VPVSEVGDPLCLTPLDADPIHAAVAIDEAQEVDGLAIAGPRGVVKIGPVELNRIPFITLVGAEKNSHTSEFDGLLTTGQFKRVFICHADHYAVLDPS